MTTEEPTEPTPWTYQDHLVIDPPSEAFAFIYLVTDRETGEFYVGRKQLWFSKFKVTKGKRRKVQVESDWRTYRTSSTKVQLAFAEGRNLECVVLHWCRTKGEANYLELKEQIDRDCLTNPLSWNEQIRVRVHRSHLKHLQS